MSDSSPNFGLCKYGTRRKDLEDYRLLDVGRRVTRTITVLSPPTGYLDFPEVNQIAWLTRIRNVEAKKTKEIVYLICSLPAHLVKPDQIAYWIQNHWSIENRLHYVRDATFGEDASTCRAGSLPHIMAEPAQFDHQLDPISQSPIHHRRPATPRLASRQRHSAPTNHATNQHT